MTAIDTQWNELFPHASRYLCAPHALPRRLRACDNSSGDSGISCMVPPCSTLYKAQVSLLHFFWIIQHAEYQPETLLLQKRKGVHIWLLQEYYILKRWSKGSKRNRKGMKKKKRQPNIEQGKPGQCGLGNGWLEDMSSEIMINYLQNSTRKIPEII